VRREIFRFADHVGAGSRRRGPRDLPFVPMKANHGRAHPREAWHPLRIASRTRRVGMRKRGNEAVGWWGGCLVVLGVRQVVVFLRVNENSEIDRRRLREAISRRHAPHAIGDRE